MQPKENARHIVWHREGQRIRAISMSQTGRTIHIRKLYQQTNFKGSLPEFVNRIDPVNTSHVVMSVLSGGGKETWTHTDNFDEAKAIVSKFNESARKADFTLGYDFKWRY